MSEENVEIVHRGYDAWNRGDEALKAFVDEHYAPDATLHQHPDFAESRIREGRDEIIREYGELREAWDESRIEVEETAERDDHVIDAIVWRGVLRGTEDAVEWRLAATWALTGGRIAEVRFLRTFADALEAAGLRE